ncbi:esterase family protein [Mycolicibacterium sp. 018/SC-01/001]|uniref:alpha/beta hydrolase n=1 Tax=Mycolicibacterium sp. 018/SC-01/001 TaxID=2592069 RepID=UPI00117C1930|nr:alpha/beta hydrolase family protein [Mycolicibacterium sp. 018/SC-01/001]TRW79881.1 esterase family protein [Mycolicibacterium sp. 018/SC-01/001]
MIKQARGGAILAVFVVSLMSMVGLAVPAHAQPEGAHITGIEKVNDRWDKVSVFSPAMNKVVVNDVFTAAKTGAPTFYLLPGIDGGDDLDGPRAPGTKSWFGMTDIQGFFANKNVNVVSPLGGPFSWYTDWVADPSKQYQTYMTKELPPLINAQYKTNGKNAVGGLSSTGGTAVDYAIQVPGLYKAVGSYSGFLTPADNAGQVALTLGSGGANADAMWGPQGGPLWVAHDPSKNVTKLAGTAVYVGASGSGNVGSVDRLPEGFGPNITGGFIERIVADSTRVFADAANAAGIPVTYVVRPDGSHTWGLFESEMQESWNTTIGPALGV